MTCEDQSDHLSVRYFHDDDVQRREFQRTLAGFVRGHRDRWDITTFLEAVEALGRRVPEIRLTLRCRSNGRLVVVIDYELAPIDMTAGRSQ